jgi:hypothetical protein
MGLLRCGGCRGGAAAGAERCRQRQVQRVAEGARVRGIQRVAEAEAGAQGYTGCRAATCSTARNSFCMNATRMPVVAKRWSCRRANAMHRAPTVPWLPPLGCNRLDRSDGGAAAERRVRANSPEPGRQHAWRSGGGGGGGEGDCGALAAARVRRAAVPARSGRAGQRSASSQCASRCS